MKIDGRKVDPALMTSTVFGMSLIGWLLFLDILYFHFILKTPFQSTHKYIILFLSMIFGGILYNYYTSEERYLALKEKFKTKGKKDILLSFSILFLPFIIVGISLFFSLEK